MWETDKWSEVRVHARFYARVKCARIRDATPRSYHLRAKTLSLLATITDLGALAGFSRKHTRT